LLSRDPLCIVNDNAGCNGENGHAEEDTEDPIAINDDSNNPDTDPNASADVTNNKKKPRKSSAEKFLEDNSEYYGFQVLPSKLRSSVENTTFETNSTTTSPTTSTFLDCLHQLPLTKSQTKSNLHQLPLTKSKTKSNSGSSDTEAELTDEMGSAAKAVSKTIKQNLLTYFTFTYHKIQYIYYLTLLLCCTIYILVQLNAQ
jgi:hypothetical protein